MILKHPQFSLPFVPLRKLISSKRNEPPDNEDWPPSTKSHSLLCLPERRVMTMSSDIHRQRLKMSSILFFVPKKQMPARGLTCVAVFTLCARIRKTVPSGGIKTHGIQEWLLAALLCLWINVDQTLVWGKRLLARWLQNTYFLHFFSLVPSPESLLSFSGTTLF